MNKRPNVLMAVFDSLSAVNLNRQLDTLPNLRALKAKSLSFSNAYACCPESSPARASLFTGLDFAVHGLWTDGVGLPKREQTLPRVFASQGYKTWLAGRRQLAGVSNWTTEHARAREYHHFDWAHGPLHRSRQNAYLTWLQGTAPDRYDAIFPNQPDPDNTGVPVEQASAMADLPDGLSFNAWIGRQAVAAIDKQAGTEPFFGIAGFGVGETKGASAALLETLDHKSLRQADEALGKIIHALPENTVVVVTAGRGSVDDANSHCLLQESALKVPLMFNGCGIKPERITATVPTMDVASTLYAFAEVKPPKRLQGQSLITGKPRGWALSRLRHPDRSRQTALMYDDWKLVADHDLTAGGVTGGMCLYNLQDDPDEVCNLANASEHADRLEDMIDLMVDARVALEDRTEPRIADF